jgi:hypothetical protein
MKRQLLVLPVAFAVVTSAALADDTRKPQKTGHPPEFFAARRAELRARKEERLERVRQYKADRAAAEEKLYQDWHDRYVADAPVREAYYRNQESAYLAHAAAAYAQPTIVYVNQSVGQNTSPFGAPSLTPSCSMSRAGFFNSNYNYSVRGVFPPQALQLPIFQP